MMTSRASTEFHWRYSYQSLTASSVKSKRSRRSTRTRCVTSRLRNHDVIDSELNGVEVDRYEMSSKPHGLAVIIAVEHFNKDRELPQSLQLPRRNGTQDEVDYLQRVFEDLGYTVLLYPDLTAYKLKIKSDAFSEKDHSIYDSFICCILSRGTDTHVYGSDGLPVKLYDFIGNFTGRRCPSLGGKPKLFFVDSHPAPKVSLDRVQQIEKLYNEKINIRFTGYDLDLNCEVSGGEQMVATETSPTDADFLVASCVRKYRGKSPAEGSSFVTRLAHALEKSHGRKEVYQVMSDVTEDFRGEISSIDSVVKLKSTLRKELYLGNKSNRIKSVTFRS
ncbi:caspase-3-like [Glandiceps talaboti]